VSDREQAYSLHQREKKKKRNKDSEALFSKICQISFELLFEGGHDPAAVNAFEKRSEHMVMLHVGHLL